MQEVNMRDTDREILREQRRKRKIRNLRIKRTILVLLSGTILVKGGIEVYIEINYKTAKEITSNVSALIYGNRSETCMYDELYLHSADEDSLLVGIDNLDHFVSAYKTINNLDLDKYNKDGKLVIPDIKRIDINEIKDLANKFNMYKSEVDTKSPSQQTSDFYSTVAKLIAYRRILTNDKFISGVNQINDFSEVFIKCIVLDGTGFDLEKYDLVETNIKGITGGEALVIKYVEPQTGMEYSLDLSRFSYLPGLETELKELNKLRAEYSYDEATGNLTGKNKDISKLVEQESKVIAMLKCAVRENYEVKKGTIKQEKEI